jgi:GTP cyclohydrolase I
MNKLYYTWNNFYSDLQKIDINLLKKSYNYISGVPRGGIPLATALSMITKLPQVSIKRAKEIGPSCLVCDDIIDSGKTRSKFPKNDFLVLHCRPNKTKDITFYDSIKEESIVYPWEEGTQEENGPTDSIIRLLEFIGEDLEREGLIETPKRVINSYAELFKGYKQEPEKVFTTFDGSQIGGLIYLKDIEFYSFCEHHMLPFYGKAHIGYIPNGKVIGVSKLARLLDIYAHRLQIQERIGEQVTNSLMQNLNPIGAACIIEARHLCIACRGVKKQHSIMGYSSFKGVFLEDSFKGIAARNEFQTLIKG